MCVCARARVCVCVRERMHVCVHTPCCACVYEFDSVCVCACMCVCVLMYSTSMWCVCVCDDYVTDVFVCSGLLVVNVTWRDKTYVGALLDATKNEWAPPRSVLNE